jgi:hypothetical protein
VKDATQKKKRKEARRLFLTGECASNAEIARKLGLKPHTVARYRKEEDWDGLRLKMDRQAAQKMAELCSSERVSLNLQHYRLYEVALAELLRTLKGAGTFSVREVGDLMAAIERAQRGQRLAKGLSLPGETEETIRAQAQAEIRKALETVIDAVKESITDEETRERVGRAILSALPQEPGTTADEPDDGAH